MGNKYYVGLLRFDREVRSSADHNPKEKESTFGLVFLESTDIKDFYEILDSSGRYCTNKPIGRGTEDDLLTEFLIPKNLGGMLFDSCSDLSVVVDEYRKRFCLGKDKIELTKGYLLELPEIQKNFHMMAVFGCYI